MPPPADQPQGGITAEDITDEKMEELITKKYLSIHKNSRPGYKLTSLQNIVVHYVANAGTTADQNWRNFENNKPGTSAHFIIDLTVRFCNVCLSMKWHGQSVHPKEIIRPFPSNAVIPMKQVYSPMKRMNPSSSSFPGCAPNLILPKKT